jgi:hypothetical protein
MLEVVLDFLTLVVVMELPLGVVAHQGLLVVQIPAAARVVVQTLRSLLRAVREL